MTRWSRFALLAIGLSGAVLLSADSAVKAQAGNAEDTALKLAGRKIRVDKSTGRQRNLTQQEARVLKLDESKAATQQSR